MYTAHAATRCQQRGIKSEIVNVLLCYGRRSYRNGAEVCFMDKATRRRAAEDLGERVFARLSDKLNTYVVIAEDGSVVTAAKRRKRLKF